MHELEQLIHSIVDGHFKVRYSLRYVDYKDDQWTMTANLNDVGLQNIIDDESIDGVIFYLQGYSVTINERNE